MIIKKNIKKPEAELVEEFQQVEPEPINEGDSYKIDLFDLDNIDFKQRQERRRGDRRRGFRRIDDRNLISRAREEAPPSSTTECSVSASQPYITARRFTSTRALRDYQKVNKRRAKSTRAVKRRCGKAQKI